MKYHKLVEKLEKYNDKIEEHSKKLNTTEIPPELVDAAKKAKAWLDSEDKVKLGQAEVPAEAPNIDPLLDYSNALGLYSKIFDEKAQSEIVEFQELVKELYDEIHA